MKHEDDNIFTKVRNKIDEIRTEKGVKPFQIARDVGEILIEDLKKHGEFFKTQEGPVFFDKEYRRVFPLCKKTRFGAVLNERYGINPADKLFDHVLEDLASEALLHGKKVEVQRFTYYDRFAKLLYISRFDGYAYQLDGRSVQRVDNGTNGVLFVDEECWESYAYTASTMKGVIDSELINSVNFISGALSTDEQRLLLKLWVIAVFFGTIQPTKMILLLLGEHGSGKTSALRRIQKFIFGSQADLLSVERDKQDGLIATITSDPIALFDNLDEQINWLPATLSRLATGVTFSRRRLYTTNEKVTFKSVSWLGITSRTVKFMEKQQDLPDRTLVLKLGRLVDRRAEDDLLESVARQRNALWSELLDELNAVVRDMNQNKDQAAISLRMADFAKLCLRVGRVWGRGSEVEKALGKLEDAQLELTPENDPIATLLRLWLSQRRNRGRRMDAGDLFEVWGEFAWDQGLDWPFDSSKGLAKALNRMQAASQQEFEIEVRENKGTKQNEYSFWPNRLPRPWPNRAKR